MDIKTRVPKIVDIICGKLELDEFSNSLMHEDTKTLALDDWRAKLDEFRTAMSNGLITYILAPLPAYLSTVGQTRVTSLALTHDR